MSLSDQILLILSDGPLTFGLIREILEKVSGYKNKKVIWSTLVRLFQNGLVKKTKTREGFQFSLTSKGSASLPKDPTFIQKPKKSWDKKWRLVIFDFPQNKRREKDKFLLKLKESGFARVQSSAYITVHNVLDEVKKEAQRLKILDHINLMLVEDINEDPKTFAEKIWPLKDLARKYTEYVKIYKNGYRGKEFSSEVLRFWLKKARYEYLKILHTDPVLPKELLTLNWPGYKAEEIYNQLENILRTY